MRKKSTTIKNVIGNKTRIAKTAIVMRSANALETEKAMANKSKTVVRMVKKAARAKETVPAKMVVRMAKRTARAKETVPVIKTVIRKKSRIAKTVSVVKNAIDLKTVKAMVKAKAKASKSDNVVVTMAVIINK